MNTHFAPGGEFSLIEALFDASHFAPDGQGLGDDAYLLKAGGATWAISTDSSVEGLHYRLDWCSPEEALEKALLSNLSDVNAMGGRTALAFLNLGALKSWDEGRIRLLGRTLSDMEARYGFRVAGGDTVRKPAESFFTFMVMGPVEGKPLLRGNARPGHRIYVSGRLGRSAAGLACLQARGRDAGREKAWEPFVSAHLHPEPPLGLGPVIAACAHPAAAIDISDGLSSELWHLSRQSGCRLTVEWSKLPYDAVLPDLPGGAAWENWVLNGGEEYQLLFTGDFSEAELAVMGREARVREIGRVAAGEGVGLVDEGGTERELQAAGWSH
jgi:thiamine-monophosphate kinase